MPQFTKTHFIFDVDDTLADSYSFNQQMFIDTFKPFLDIFNPKIDQYLRQLHFSSRGTSMESQMKAVIDFYSLNLDPKLLVSQNEQLHIKNVGKIKTFKAVTDIMRKIKASGRQVSICTNRQTTSVQLIIKNNHLEGIFSHVISCSDAGHEKPDPHCLLQLIAHSGQPKNQFIYFGDSQTDHLFAKNAGIDFLIIDHYLNQKRVYQMILESFM